MTTTALRTVAAAAAASLATAAQAQAAQPSGGISSSGWISIVVVVGVCAALLWVYKKTT